MSGIVCALRGGPASQPTIDKAVKLAVKTNLPLYFLYVVNLDFLTHTASSRTHIISKELHEMGEFILLKAQAQAETENISAEGIVRHGQVREEIIKLCHEIEAEYVFLGQSRGQDDRDTFTQDRLKRFTQQIEQESGAQVIMAEDSVQ